MSHTYKKGELQYPSVTTIIGECSDKNALIQWSSNSAVQFCIDHWEQMQGLGIDSCLNAARFDYRRLSKEALKVGSEVHNTIEYDLKHGACLIGSEVKLSCPEADNAMMAYLHFRTDNTLDPQKVEYTVYGDGWAGTMDFKGLLDGKKTLLDWKTSKAIYMDSYGPQLGAYWVADGRWAEQAGILRLDKVKGEYELKLLKPKRLEHYYNIFCAMTELYFLRHPIIAKKAGILF
jgi:hypothetical protein